MKLTMFLSLLFAPLLLFGQTKEMAVARYSDRGNMTSIADLTGLSDCNSANISGKILKVKVEGPSAHASVKTDRGDESIVVPLDRLKPEDRSSIFKDLVRKSMKVRIGGYRCSESEPISVFSVDRIY